MSFLDQFVDYITAVKNYSEHTILNYKSDIKFFENYIADQYDVELELCDKQMVRSYIVKLRSEGLSARSINRKISTLKSFYKFLLRNNEIQINPTNSLSLLRTPKRLPSYVVEPKLDQMLSSHIDPSFENIRESLVIKLLYFTGMRKMELINLKREDVDRQKKQIKVLGKGNKERIIPITSTLVEEVNNYESTLKEVDLYDKSNYLIVSNKGTQAYAKLIYNIVNRVLSVYNLSDKQSPHVLRHTFATHLANNGADLNAIKELLGHSSLAATQVYTHNTIEKLKNAYKNAHPKS